MLLAVLLVVLTFSALGRAQNLYGSIKGAVEDKYGVAIPNATVTARNQGTGEVRTTTTNDDGEFQFPLLSPGGFIVSAEAEKFNRIDKDDINLSAGDTVTVIFGGPNETVTVTSDAAISDTSRIPVGRRLDSRDIENLPLLSRQLYNLILLQPGVNGREVSNPLAIDMSAAGLQRRVGYQVDGSNSNDFHRSGFRLNLLSETSAQEVQLLTTGYSAEFGGTAGAIVNVTTASGTNDLNGTVSVLYRPSELSAKPFAFQPGTDPNTSAHGVTVTLGGAIIKDRWHYFASYEWTRRHFVMPITITPENRDHLIRAGLSPSIFINSHSTSDTYPYFNVRTDADVGVSTRLSVRFNNFFSDLEYSGPGGVMTTDRSFGLSGPNYALSAQARTEFSQDFVSEFRFQIGKSLTRITGDERTGRGPTVTINPAVAGFGPDLSVGSISPNEHTVQFQESIIRIVRKHIFKFGGGVNFIADRSTGQLFSQYTFPGIGSYELAVAGVARQGYSKYQESSGNYEVPVNAIYYNTFLQDEWHLSRRASLSLGLRYEYFDPPSGDASAPLGIGKSFNSDGDNFAPRLGFTYSLHEGKYPTIIRFAGGAHYDPPLLVMYRRALLNNGNSRYVSYTFPGGSGPDFPNKVAPGSFPPDLDTIAPDFKTMYAIRSSVQVEQALSNDMSVTLGYVNSIARHVPVYRNMNCLPTGRTLADGRPVYGTAGEPCVNKVYSQFNIVKIVESGGNQNYNGIFIQFMKRSSSGIQVNANYTLSNSVDDAPEENGAAALTLSDPSSRRTDRGSSRGDLTHVFNMSFVLNPKFSFQNSFLNTVFNHNQFSAIVIADSGETFNITTGDLNGDGVTGSDRPVGIARNSGRLPAYIGVDARYSRKFSLSDKRSLEFYIEATNVFNKKQVSAYQRTILRLNVDVDPTTGLLLHPLLDPSTMEPTWRESRQVQLGLKFHF
jgi:hypothetical protein